MKITILTLGSRGDVQPYLALGVGLRAAGHRVTLASHETFRTFVESRGLGFWPTAGNPIEAIQASAGHHWLESSQNPLVFVRRMFAVAQPMMKPILDAYVAASKNADLILYPILASLAATSIGEKFGIPVCPAYLQHVHRTHRYPWSLAQPRPGLRRWPFLEGAYNRCSHWLAEQIFWQFIRPIINRWRTRELGLTPYPWRSEFSAWTSRRMLCLYGFSPKVVPKPPEWGPNIQLTGYWFLERDASWQVPAKLHHFLDAGAPPVYIGFGSMSNRSPETVAEIVLRALAATNQRGILLTGWGGLRNVNLPPDALAVESVPHDWLFPRMAAVVHHGGCGTTATGLAAGVPTIVVPFFADQPFWASRVHALGAGPEPISRKNLSVERLAAAIWEATTDPSIQNCARQIGNAIRAEDGVDRAVALIDQNF